MNRQHPRVLIVEDDLFAAITFARLFEGWFWEVVSAYSVAEAIALLDVPLDLVLLDMQLPDGSGVEVLKAIRARGLPMPVVVATARGLDALDEVRALKPAHILEKPFAFETFKHLASRIYTNFRPRPSR